MTPTEILTVLKSEKIQVTPVLNSKGDIDYWTAGFRKVRSDGMNYIPNHMIARGASLEEAVEKLMSRQTLFILNKEGALIENEST
jgi:hypothetical protein